MHHLPPSYSDCASYAVPVHLLRPSSDHLLTCRLGSGKVSDVFEAEEVRTGARTVFKCLKPVQERKVRRELLVLSHLAPAAGDGRYPPPRPRRGRWFAGARVGTPSGSATGAGGGGGGAAPPEW